MKQMQPWYWRSLPLEDRTGSAVFAALFEPDSNPDAIATLLESPYPTLPKRCQQRASPTHLARYSICAGAPRIVDGVEQLWTPPTGEILPFLQQLLQVANSSSPLVSPDPPLPFTGGWLGWLGYDLAWEFEQLPYLNKDSLPFPVAYWYEPECFAVLDHWEQILWLAASNPSQLERLQSRLMKGAGGAGEAGEAGEVGGENSLLTSTGAQLCAPTHYSLLTSQEQYEAAVRRAKKYIQAGDIFQANLSLRFEADTAASSWTIYQALQQINPSPFASYWQTPWGAIISCSPERLVCLQNGQAETRPIAGTRRKGATPQQDRQLAQDLLDNATLRAANFNISVPYSLPPCTQCFHNSFLSRPTSS